MQFWRDYWIFFAFVPFVTCKRRMESKSHAFPSSSTTSKNMKLFAQPIKNAIFISWVDEFWISSRALRFLIFGSERAILPGRRCETTRYTLISLVFIHNCKIFEFFAALCIFFIQVRNVAAKSPVTRPGFCLADPWFRYCAAFEP